MNGKSPHGKFPHGKSPLQALCSQDALSGLMFMAFAGGFAFLARDLSLGTAVRMGAAYFPLLLSGLLGLIGLVIFVRALIGEGGRVAPFAWRALVLVVAAVLVFGFGLSGLGLAPSVAIAAFLATLASGQVGWRGALALSALLVVFTWAVFILGLGLAIPTIGTWLS
ncbi:tripartite tricarboxylate transporter TctB family protein [Ancylobacter oerskovii]|uniref:Tripartite tricarboxylate transporter TctB family protein n=1 Tax=Ancylobacter oerskovii TaxID=459519 RepID=A0ABW4YYE6_9HYPH|nr:tripartite tricarboxylate transporter TctB family protein [Ancylobacter oerskovii]MBS7541660.1 tripartite tricarboxylate transporter TctB family protein [Ancylobacter oerskovii]